MKRKILSISVAVMLGTLSLTSCVDNEESQSVQNLRDAKAEQLKSLASMYSAQGEAELIRAKAKASVDDAIAAMKILMNEEKSLQNEIAKAAQAEKIKTAIATAQAELKIAEKKLADKVAELKVEQDKVFTAALKGYNDAFKELYEGEGETKGLIQSLNTEKSELIELKAGLVSLEEWCTEKIADLTIKNATKESLIAQYKTLPDNGIEKIKTDLVAAKQDAKIKAEVSKKAIADYNVTYSAFVTKKRELNIYNVNIASQKTIGSKGSFGTYNNCNIVTKMETYLDGTKFIESYYYDMDNSYAFVGKTTSGTRQSSGNDVGSDYVMAIQDFQYYFYGNSSVETVQAGGEKHEYILDASKNITISHYDNSYEYFKVINTERAEIYLDEFKSLSDKTIKDKTASKEVYTAAKTVTDNAFADWKAETDAEKKDVALTKYTEAKAASNLAFFLMDYNTIMCDGGNYIEIRNITTDPSREWYDDGVPADVKLGAFSSSFTGNEEEGVYPSHDITITTVVKSAKELDGKGVTVETVTTYRPNVGYIEGAHTSYTNAADAYAKVTNADLTAQYQAVIDKVEKLNGETCKLFYAQNIATYNQSTTNSLVTAMENIIGGTTDIAAKISKLEGEIAENKATIENINREVSPNDTDTDTNTVEKKQQAIEIGEATIARIETSISINDVLLKKFKAEIDALTK